MSYEPQRSNPSVGPAPLWMAPVLAILLSLLMGCAGHAHRTADARKALDEGRPRKALALFNEALGVERGDELPADTSGDNALLILDRSMVLMQLGEHALSSRDLQLADKQIELLDLSRTTADDIGRYIYSDDTGPYMAPAYEKLMINTMNMVNYLVRGNLQGARVEARRLAVLQKYLASQEAPDVSLTGAGSYLAGFVFEKSDRPQEALRYYDEALQYGTYESLGPVVDRLASRASYRSPRLRALMTSPSAAATTENSAAAAAAAATTESSAAATTEHSAAATTEHSAAATTEHSAAATTENSAAATTENVVDELDILPAPAPETETQPTVPLRPPELGELLIVVSYGRVPAKHAERVPIGLALTWSATHMSPAQSSQANRLAAQGLVTWVNYPELGKSRGRFSIPTVTINGYPQPVEGLLAVDLESKKAWEETRGVIVGAAITRTLTRLVAGEAVRQASGEGALGFLLSLGTQATLSAADTPDTRSWSTLPARIAFARVPLAPGTHHVDVSVRGVRQRKPVTMQPGGWAVLNLTVLS